MVSPSFAEYAELWLVEAELSNRTKTQRWVVYKRDIFQFLDGRLMVDINTDDIRRLCDRVKSRGARATAVHVFDFLKSVFEFARAQGYAGDNPAASVRPTSIASFEPRHRALSPCEIGILCRVMEGVPIRLEYRLALKLLLLTLVRKGELVGATWDEIDFEFGVWTIPPGRAKAKRPRGVYLSQQAIDILMTLKDRAGACEYILPSAIDPYVHISPVCLNHATAAILKAAQTQKLLLGQFSVFDLRRTGEAILREAGFNAHWIELALAREEIMRRRRLFNPDDYAGPVQNMMQEWADMIDAWTAGKTHAPILTPLSTKPTSVEAL